MFTESAYWYDRFQAGQDYAGKAQRVMDLIRDIQPRAHTLRRPGGPATAG